MILGHRRIAIRSHLNIMLPCSAGNQVAVQARRPWGKIIGVILGFLLAGFWGAVIGFVIGHIHDAQRAFAETVWLHSEGTGYEAFSSQAQQATFTMGVIVLSAKMARSDGHVSREEIAAFKRVFNIRPSQEASIGFLFDSARLSPDGFEPYAFRMAHVFRNSPSVLEEVLTGLFIIAGSDSAGLSPAEVSFLKEVAVIFGFNEDDFARIAARSGVSIPASETRKSAPAAPEPFTILGVAETASAEEIKAAYRALVREHHPDKLTAQGMPEEFVATATEKIKRINAAYDDVCKMKGIR